MHTNRRKTLPLHAGVCCVRAVPCKKNNVFELASRKGAKRLWMCRSEEDRAEWLQAIAEATMPAGLLGPGGLDGMGPYAPFLHDMRRYRGAKAALKAAADRGAYQRAVAEALLLEAEAAAKGQGQGEEQIITVPFAWVRAQIADAADGAGPGSPQRQEHAAGSGGGGGVMARSSGGGGGHHHHHQHGTHRRPRSGNSSHSNGKHAGQAIPASFNPQGELAQLWKDMARDKVCINGRVLYGEDAAGPEAILGALARTITQLAARAKELEVLLLPASRPASQASQAHTTRPAAPPSQQQQQQQQPLPPLSGLTEVQIVSHTLEILLACNRTQSGGDTYACVEYLFRHEGLVVVCPYSSHAEPLQISLELLWDGEAAPHVTLQQQQPLQQQQSGSGSRPSSINYSRASATAIPAPAAAAAAPRTAAPPLPPLTSSLSRSNSFSSKATAGPSSSPSSAGSATSSPSAAGPAPPQPQQQEQEQQQQQQRPISASLALSFDPSSPSGVAALFPRPLPWSAPAAPTSAAATATGAHAQPPVNRRRSHHYFESAMSTVTAGSDGADSVLSRTAGTDDSGDAHRQPPSNRRTPTMIATAGAARPVILVRVQANTAYKVCPLDPQDDDGSDIWVTVAARFEQRFTISSSGVTKSQELIRLRTELARGRDEGEQEQEREWEASAAGLAVAPSSWASSTASSVAALGAVMEKQHAAVLAMGSPEASDGGDARDGEMGEEPPAEAAT